jgi:hypothetical protein
MLYYAVAGCYPFTFFLIKNLPALNRTLRAGWVTKNQGLQRTTLRSTAEPLWPAERNHFDSAWCFGHAIGFVAGKRCQMGRAAQRSSRACPARCSALERYGCTLKAEEAKPEKR